MFLFSKPDFYWQEFYPHNGKDLFFFLPLRTMCYYEGVRTNQGQDQDCGIGLCGKCESVLKKFAPAGNLMCGTFIGAKVFF